MARFVLEARRRGLLKVATAYLIVTWLVLEIGHTLFLVFDLPHGALQFIFVLLALGFPVMLVAVWHGWLGASISATEVSPDKAHASAHHEGPWLAVVFGAVALFAVAVAIGVRFFGMGGSASAHVAPSQTGAPGHVATTPATTTPVIPPAFDPPAHSIAVLPFVNMSGDPQQEYFSEGLAEELLNSLVRISELKVAARTSAFAFNGKEMEIRDIARKLNVGAILEGSVRKAGEQVRITVQLVDAANGYQLWSQTYDRQLDDIFQVQADIATNVVRLLQATLINRSALRTHTPSAEAYAAYLQGNYFWYGHLQRDNAIAHYEQALQLDEHYADAMAGLAEARFGWTGGVRPDTDVVKARELIDRAIALDPRLVRAHVVRASIARTYDFDWAAAEASLKRAQEIEPSNPRVMRAAALLAETLGHFDESEALMRQALERDPLDGQAHLILGRMQWADGKNAAAVASMRKYAELAPGGVVAHYVIARSYLRRKEPEKALAEAELEPNRMFRLELLAAAYHDLHRKAESDAALRELTDKHARDAAFRIAETYAYRHEADQAMRWLEQAYQNRDGDLSRLLTSPGLRTLAHDPRYKAFLRKLNLRTDVAHPIN
jgi:TolB-like protein/cytochrome c-type biogenesis protein CcmH/NrfG